MTTLYIIYSFIFGIVLGSFYNVVAYRVPKRLSIISPPSTCPNCKHQLTKRELIPIISYIIQGAKCKNCKIHIPVFYPLVEFITGLLFVITYLIFGNTLMTLVGFVFVSVLIIITMSDLLYFIISDEVLIVGFILINILNLLIGTDYFFKMLISSLTAFAFLYLIKIMGDFILKKESMGGGDIKLMLIFGLVLPIPLNMLPVFLASFLSIPFMVILIKRNTEKMIPFGPFLSAAALIIFYNLDFFINYANNYIEAVKLLF